VRDLGARLAVLRQDDGRAAETLLAAARQQCAARPALAALLTKVEEQARADKQRFGPVRATDPGAAERLALMTYVSIVNLSQPRLLREAAREFALFSRGDPARMFAVAVEVDTLLGARSKYAYHWRNQVIPQLLERTVAHPHLVLFATTGELPASWAAAQKWLAPWVAGRSLKDLLVQDPDGLPTQDPWKCPAMHPLVLLQVEPRVQKMLATGTAGDKQQAREFLDALTQRIVRERTWEAAYAGGTFIVRVAGRAGVSIDRKGRLSHPAGQDWLARDAQKVLEIVVQLFERYGNPPLESTYFHARSPDGNAPLVEDSPTAQTALRGIAYTRIRGELRALNLALRNPVQEIARLVRSDAGRESAEKNAAELRKQVAAGHTPLAELQRKLGSRWSMVALPDILQEEPVASRVLFTLAQQQLAALPQNFLSVALGIEDAWAELYRHPLARHKRRPPANDVAWAELTNRHSAQRSQVLFASAGRATSHIAWPAVVPSQKSTRWRSKHLSVILRPCAFRPSPGAADDRRDPHPVRH
jgi:hypothetical protein